MEFSGFHEGTISKLSLFIPFPAIGFVSLAFWYIWQYVRSPLRRYPGPFLAGWTDLWRLYHVWHGNCHLLINDLHKKYGPVVRIGPNLLDLDLPGLVKTIYNIKGDWVKTEFYHGSSVLGPNRKIIYNLFSQTDEAQHAREKRPIARYYSMNGIQALEPHVDSTIGRLCNELEKRFIDPPNAGVECDLGTWVLFYTWDVVGEVTFSQPIGYLEKGHDFNKLIWTAERALHYFSVVGQIPVLDYWFDKNPVYRVGPPGFGTAVDLSAGHMVERMQGKTPPGYDPARPDFLDRFLEAKKLDPDLVDDAQIVSYLMINMLAGADTTACTVRSVLYYCLKAPNVWRRLQSEIGTCKDIVTFKDARSMPYLKACVREAMRILPPIGMLLERYVPAQGFTLPDGSHVPPGVVVGLNPYVIGRNTKVFGDDADTFRPERWLRDEAADEDIEAFAKRLAMMNASDLTFGAGSRICIGMHLGLVETYKVIATLVARYDIKLVHPGMEWTVINNWFMRQEGLSVRISKRI